MWTALQQYICVGNIMELTISIHLFFLSVVDENTLQQIYLLIYFDHLSKFYWQVNVNW